MIFRQHPNLITTYTEMVKELAYPVAGGIKPLKWGVCLGYPEPVNVKIDDMLENDNLTLGISSYTKSRWTRFLRRYFRPDFPEWMEEAKEKLHRYPSRPFVASYSPNLDTGHTYGGCLSSLQIRIAPKPEVILYSRACHIDKVGFLDLALMHVVARELGLPEVSGRWTITLGFISAISQPYYMARFKTPLEGHRLAKSIVRLNAQEYDDIKFGPLKRGRKRIMQLEEHGEIPRSVPLSVLTLDPGRAK